MTCGRLLDLVQPDLRPSAILQPHYSRQTGLFAVSAFNLWNSLPAHRSQLIGSAPTKTSRLDPVPTWLVKDVRSLLSPFAALMFNTSLVSHRLLSFGGYSVWTSRQRDEEFYSSVEFIMSLF